MTVPNPAQPVNLTQLRNILAGTRPWDPGAGTNGDANVVLVNGQAFHLPNNIFDVADVAYANSNAGVQANTRLTPPVAGRWGEPYSVPTVTSPAFAPQWPYYNNPVRAGLSKAIVNNINGSYYYAYVDADDDNYDTTDPWPSRPVFSVFANLAPNGLVGAETANYYDLSGSLSLAVERIRRFVTPIDTAGDSVLGQYNNSNANQGADLFGRVAYFKYSRPPGLPTQVVTSPNVGVNPTPSYAEIGPQTIPTMIPFLTTVTTPSGRPLRSSSPATTSITASSRIAAR